MFQVLTFLHSAIRWFVIVMLIYSIYRAYRGYIYKTSFTKTDNLFRHLTATTAHVQLMLGIILYTQSPLVKHFWDDAKQSIQDLELLFFSVIHITLMITAIIILTIGSATAKRKLENLQKFKTMLFYFSAALLIILLAIPWPFSPLAHRPLFR